MCVWCVWYVMSEWVVRVVCVISAWTRPTQHRPNQPTTNTPNSLHPPPMLPMFGLSLAMRHTHTNHDLRTSHDRAEYRSRFTSHAQLSACLALHDLPSQLSNTQDSLVKQSPLLTQRVMHHRTPSANDERKHPLCTMKRGCCFVEPILVPHLQRRTCRPDSS